MRTDYKRLNNLLTVLRVALVCSALLLAGDALAGKGGNGNGQGGGGGGGETDPPPAGTIYFEVDYTMQMMNADGSGKASLPVYGFSEPSLDWHGGLRWFLTIRDVAGTYPDETQRRELFAVREDGDETYTVQLTDNPTLKAGDAHDLRWATDITAGPPLRDGLVSWAAVRWDLASGTVVGAGIYVLPVAFDNNGNLDPQPIVQGLFVPQLLVPAGVIDGAQWTAAGYPNRGLLPSIFGHDWLADGTAIVYDDHEDMTVNSGGLWIYDLLTDASIPLSDDGHRPTWSPDGQMIAFDSLDGVETISLADGSRDLILRDRSRPSGFLDFGRPRWSPTGSSHLIFQRIDYNRATLESTTDIYISNSDGSGQQNLTSDTEFSAFPIAWR